MPFAFCYPLNRSWMFSFNEPCSEVCKRVASDLKVDAESVEFFHPETSEPVVGLAVDGMRVSIKIKNCGDHEEKNVTSD